MGGFRGARNLYGLVRRQREHLARATSHNQPGNRMRRELFEMRSKSGRVEPFVGVKRGDGKGQQSGSHDVAQVVGARS
jgi:hypothetical protein